jgi:hypothetical protein
MLYRGKLVEVKRIKTYKICFVFLKINTNKKWNKEMKRYLFLVYIYKETPQDNIEVPKKHVLLVIPVIKGGICKYNPTNPTMKPSCLLSNICVGGAVNPLPHITVVPNPLG